MSRKVWQIGEPSEAAKALAKERNLSIIFAQVLLNRGIGAKELDAFLNPSLDFLYEPKLLPDMDKAVLKIKEVLTRGEKILIAGDYDVDGITSLAIFYEFVKNFPKQYDFYIPHRVNDGYGLSKEAIEKAKEFGAKLVVAFDCGTNSTAEIEFAQSLNIEVIVVDHHHPQEDFNSPYAFVNPKRKDSNYPFKDLSAGALSFKLLQALTGQPCYDALDLAALSIVCDVVPLKNENRIILKEGLEQLRRSPRPAIKALCSAGSIKQENITSFHLGFILGPRINACGRVAHAREALDLFLATKESEALLKVQKLVEYNNLRKSIEADILKQAQAIVENSCLDDQAIVACGDNWHPGVLGIVASRLCEKYSRPAFVISFDENIGKGSGRSTPNVHLMETLQYCAPYLSEFGGHKKAAGISLTKDNLAQFKQSLNNFIQENISQEDLVCEVAVDSKLSFDQINDSLVEELETAKPFGEENARPLFVTRGVTKKSPAKKLKSGYVVWLSQNNITFEGSIYDPGLLEILDFAQSVDILYHLENNPYHNAPRLVIKDLRIA